MLILLQVENLTLPLGYLDEVSIARSFLEGKCSDSNLVGLGATTFSF